MHVVIAKNSAASPKKAMESLDLPKQFWGLLMTRCKLKTLGWGMHAVAAKVH